MKWNIIEVGNMSTYPQLDVPVMVTYFDTCWKTGIATLRHRQKYGGYYWWGEYGVNGWSVVQDYFQYKSWLEIIAWTPIPKPYDYGETDIVY